MSKRELTEREMAIEKEYRERFKYREKSKTVKPTKLLEKFIGETLERIHIVPSDTLKTKTGYKSIVLCFGNGKSIHLDAEMHLCKEGVLPVIRSSDGDYEMIKTEKPLDEENCGSNWGHPDHYQEDVEKPVEEMTTKELVESGKVEPSVQHKPGCASYNNPPAGFASSVTDCDCQDTDLPNITDTSRDYGVAHVHNEQIKELDEGYLGYSPKSEQGKILLNTVIFTTGRGVNEVILGTCESNGNIVSASEKIGVTGGVAVNGHYFFKSTKGLNLATDIIYVSYDYEYKLAKD